MKRLFRVEQASTAIHVALFIIRVGAAAFMLTHGLPKLGALVSDQPVQFADPFGLGPTISLALSVFAEAICALFVLVGLGTRLAVIPLIINMLVALVHVHADDPFSKMELPLFFLLIFIALLFAGSGKYAFDYLWQRRRAANYGR